MALGTVLPSGPAAAQNEPAPVYHIATAAPNAVARLNPSEVGPITEVSGAQLRGTMKFDGALRIIGDIDGKHLHVVAEHIEVMGAVKGENIWLDARAPQDRNALNIADATSHDSQIIIHGDVQVTDSRIGAPGTGSVLIHGHTELFRQSQDYGLGGGHIKGKEVCITGNLYSQQGSSVNADTFTIGRDLNGNAFEAYPYTHPVTADHPGRTVIGRNIVANHTVITNAEVAVGGYTYGERLEFRQQRDGAAPPQTAETECGFEPRADRLPFSARP